MTNQSGIAREYYTENDVNELHKYINKELKQHNIKIHDFFILLIIQKESQINMIT